ncbi:hypothetical protein B9G98_04518 [Wickerhamiella sorbophila]|uniref:Major facilitator superfamily (MFS) profile domain-containing protein n=1 Tax=Wickerhamiella sorbophila TaxID=45607 RepID=A0A2T0FPJ6_9ASCO|nr:hypothetical protein B9G98_04518 [Wickerhamiella sorbophila]PRT56898.1 hypothetical protein B9G98_04518 [Wickerhamiella sorbophila]
MDRLSDSVEFEDKPCDYCSKNVCKPLQPGELGFIPFAELVVAHTKGVPDLPAIMGPNNKAIPTVPNDHLKYRVDYNGPDDPLNPLNWSRFQRIFHIAMVCYAGMVVMWGMTVWASVEKFLKPIYHLSWSVCGLGLALYIMGLMAGPGVWIPLSQLHGRRPMLVYSMLGATVFTWWTSTAQYYYQFMIYRFFTGAFGAGALSISVDVFKDLSTRRSVVDTSISVYTIMSFGAPVLAPWVSDCVGFSFLGWRWMFTLQGIMMSSSFVLLLLFFRETSSPVVLQSKARYLRIRTGNRFIYSAHDHTFLDLSLVIHNFFAGPIKFLTADPILAVVSIYQGFLFALLYLTMEGIPLTFLRYGWNGPLTAICSLSMFIGMVIASAVQIFITNPQYRRYAKEIDVPESPPLRLWTMLPGAIVLPISLFWWFWTGFYLVHWICPTIAMAFTGFGLVTAYAPALNFVYVSYNISPEVALSANSITRALMMGMCPFFVKAMYFTLGMEWAGTLLGCLATVLGALPYIVFWVIPLWGHPAKDETHKEYRKGRWEKILHNQIIKQALTKIDSHDD